MKKDINVPKLNDLIGLAYNILKILLILMVIVGVYAGIMLLKEIKVLPFILTIIKIISPLFIGLFIAWLFDPIVTFLEKKGMRRILGSTTCYIVFIGFVIIVLSALIPVLSNQTSEFVSNTLPAVFDKAEDMIDITFDKLDNIKSLDANSMKLELFSKLELFATNLTSSLPEVVVNFLKTCFSGIGVFFIGLIIGFYLLLDFDKNAKNLYLLLPTKYRKKTHDMLSRINMPLKRFINGSLIDMSLIFVVCSIGFSIIGLKSPLLFALFCAITNIIPYVGPYIGGAPAVLVGLTQGTPIGIAVLIFIIVTQALEGNLIQPLIMSKTTKLKPVTIIVGLLIFGKLFGMWGMVLSTPILGVLKEILTYFDEKYEFLNFKE